MKIIIVFDSEEKKKEFVGEINGVVDNWRERGLEIEMTVD